MEKIKPPCLLSRRKCYLWGQPHWVQPALVKRKFGNGKRLIALWPILHRPLYYLVYVDDSWSLYNSDEKPLIDHLDDIYEQIGEEFGERSEEDAGEYHWPEADFNDGSTWAEASPRFEKLTKRKTRRAQRKENRHGNNIPAAQ